MEARGPTWTGPRPSRPSTPTTGASNTRRRPSTSSATTTDDMYRVRSEQVDLLVTPNHRMWVKAYDTQANKRGEEPYRVRLASEIVGKRVAYQKTAVWQGQESGKVAIPGTKRIYQRTDSDTKTTRHYVGYRVPARGVRAVPRATGWPREASMGTRSVSRRTAVSAWRKWPRTSAAMGLPAYEVATGHGAVRTQQVALRDSLAACGRRSYEKRVPSYVHQWGPSILRVFLEAYVDGDGSRRRDGNHTVIYTSSARDGRRPSDPGDQGGLVGQHSGRRPNGLMRRRWRAARCFENAPALLHRLAREDAHASAGQPQRRQERLVGALPRARSTASRCPTGCCSCAATGNLSSRATPTSSSAIAPARRSARRACATCA